MFTVLGCSVRCSVPVLKDHGDKSIINAENLCVKHARRLASLAVVSLRKGDDVHVVTDTADERALAGLMGWSAPATSKKKSMPVKRVPPLNVDIHFPIGDPVTDDDDEEVPSRDDESPACVNLSGSMFVQDIVMQEATCADMLSALREDMERNLTTRIQLIIELDEEVDEQERTDLQILPGNRALPVRLVASPKEESSVRMPFTEFISPGKVLTKLRVGLQRFCRGAIVPS